MTTLHEAAEGVLRVIDDIVGNLVAVPDEATQAIATLRSALAQQGEQARPDHREGRARLRRQTETRKDQDMTDTRKAMQQALEVLGKVHSSLAHGIAETDASQNFCEVPKSLSKKVEKAMQSLREALAQQGEQQPVGTIESRTYEDGTPAGNVINWVGRNAENDFPDGTKLYTAAPAAQQGEPVAWEPIETAPTSGVVLLAVVDASGEKRTFCAEASFSDGNFHWEIAVGWTGFARLHSGWTPTNWAQLPIYTGAAPAAQPDNRKVMQPVASPEMLAAARDVLGSHVEDTDSDYQRIYAAFYASAPAAQPVNDNPYGVERPNDVADYGHDNSVSQAYQTPYYCAKCGSHMGDTDLPKNVPLRKAAICWECEEKAAPAAQPVSQPQWQPIETAPKGRKGYSWMLLAWGPEEDRSIGYGMHADGKFYASATFYCLGQARQYQMREIEVSPTHWMPLPPAPGAAAPAAQPVAGWKLVPVEPTDDMLYEIQENCHILPPRGKRIWAQMLAAAPAAQPDAIDPRTIRKFLQALQAGEMTVSRAVEILDAWLNGTYSDDMVPPPPPDSALIADDDFPLDVLRRERAAMRTMVDQIVNASTIRECAQAIQACELWLKQTQE